MTLIAPSFCSLDSAIDTGRTTARRLQQTVTVRWGAVTFAVTPNNTGAGAFQSYLAAARVLIRLNDAAQGRVFATRWDPDTGEIK